MYVYFNVCIYTCSLSLARARALSLSLSLSPHRHTDTDRHRHRHKHRHSHSHSPVTHTPLSTRNTVRERERVRERASESECTCIHTNTHTDTHTHTHTHTQTHAQTCTRAYHPLPSRSCNPKQIASVLSSVPPNPMRADHPLRCRSWERPCSDPGCCATSMRRHCCRSRLPHPSPENRPSDSLDVGTNW
jgi:hypothetical protein